MINANELKMKRFIVLSGHNYQIKRLKLKNVKC